MTALAELQNPHVVSRFETVKPPTMQWEAELGFAQQLLRANSYMMGIADQNPSSLVHALVNVAAIGLSLNPTEQLAYLVPRKGKICLDPSYKGLVKLATDSGAILFVQAKLVFANDQYENTGVDTKPVHTFNPFSDRGEFVGCYCVAKTRDGSYLTEEMTAEEILMIRDKSSEAHKGGKGSPWDDWLGEMARKTVVRRASKLWTRSLDPAQSQRMYQAIDISNENAGLELTLTNPSAGGYSDESKSFFDELIERSDSSGMLVFNKSIDERDFQALYHSFEKGSKGANQAIVDNLLREGHATVELYVQMVEESASDEDMMAAITEMEGLFDLVHGRVSNEPAMEMLRLKPDV